jgi:hypothetical protein
VATAVVGARVGAEGVRRADRDGRRLVPGEWICAVDLLPRSVLAVVARGRDDHDARVHELAHGAAERVVRYESTAGVPRLMLTTRCCRGAVV